MVDFNKDRYFLGWKEFNTKSLSSKLCPLNYNCCQKKSADMSVCWSSSHEERFSATGVWGWCSRVSPGPQLHTGECQLPGLTTSAVFSNCVFVFIFVFQCLGIGVPARPCHRCNNYPADADKPFPNTKLHILGYMFKVSARFVLFWIFNAEEWIAHSVHYALEGYNSIISNVMDLHFFVFDLNTTDTNRKHPWMGHFQL